MPPRKTEVCAGVEAGSPQPSRGRSTHRLGPQAYDAARAGLGTYAESGRGRPPLPGQGRAVLQQATARRTATETGNDATRGRLASPRMELPADVWEPRRGRRLGPAVAHTSAGEAAVLQGSAPIPIPGTAFGRALPRPWRHRSPSYPSSESSSPGAHEAGRYDLVGPFDDWEFEVRSVSPRPQAISAPAGTPSAPLGCCGWAAPAPHALFFAAAKENGKADKPAFEIASK